MKLELEEMGNIHTETVWLEIVGSQSSWSDEGNTIATMAGLTETHYQLGRLFTAAPDLLAACCKQQLVIEKLLSIYSLKRVSADFPSRLINNARSYAKKAIAKAKGNK